MENTEHIIKSIENDYESWLNYKEENTPTVSRDSIPMPLDNYKNLQHMTFIVSINTMIHQMNVIRVNINTLMCIMMMNNMN